MFDYVKVAIKDKDFANGLLTNPLLNFTRSINEVTGEVRDLSYFANYRGLDFKVFHSGFVEIKGSLHKYWNNGIHNFNDFGIEAITDTVNDLKRKFNLTPETARLRNLEIGVNIITPFKPSALLNALVTYQNEPFSKMKVIGPGNGRYVDLQQYKIKIYDKGLQFSKPENILRFEKKITKMKNLGNRHFFLSDLKKITFMQHCLNALLDSFNELIIAEKIDFRLLKKHEIKIYESCSNPRNWMYMSRNKRSIYRKRFHEIIDKYGNQRLKKLSFELILKKGEQLMKIS